MAQKLSDALSIEERETVVVTTTHRGVRRRARSARAVRALAAPRPEPKPQRIRVNWYALSYEQREMWGGLLSNFARQGLLVCWAEDVLERVFLAGVDNATDGDVFGMEVLIGEALEVLGVHPPRNRSR
jgi:hypothetical protein